MVLARDVLAQARADALVVLDGRSPSSRRRWGGSCRDGMSERTTVNLSICRDSSGRCSQTRMPGTLVAMRFELAADLGRGVGLHVEGVVVRRAAVEEDDQARFRLAERGRPGCVARRHGPGAGGGRAALRPNRPRPPTRSNSRRVAPGRCAAGPVMESIVPPFVGCFRAFRSFRSSTGGHGRQAVQTAFASLLSLGLCLPARGTSFSTSTGWRSSNSLSVVRSSMTRWG